MEDPKFSSETVLLVDLLNGDVVSATYTTSSGIGANGLLQFDNIATFIDDEGQSVTSGITISLTERPEGGKDAETTEAIKFSAPKFYSAFGRAVSTQDYEAIIPNIYPNVASIACYGGEEAEPPEFGKVFLAIKPKNADKLSLSEKNVVLKQCFREYSVAAVQPEIIDPSILYIDIDSFIYFNPNITRKDACNQKFGISTLIALNSGSEFNKFGGKFKYSKFLRV